MNQAIKSNMNFLKGNYTGNLEYFFQDFPHAVSGQNQHITSFVLDKNGQIQPYGNVEVKKEAWILHSSAVYEQKVCRKGRIYNTNIEVKKLPAMKSRAVDELVQSLLHSGDYIPENMLVLDNPYQVAPLTFLILFYTEKACKIRVTVKGMSGGDDISGTTEIENYHKVPVFGLYPEIENQIILEFLDENDISWKQIQFVYQGCLLPEELKNMVFIDEQREKSALGLVFVYGAQTKYPYAFDSQGNIRYYLCKSPNNYGIYFLSQGRILLAEKLILSPSFANPHSSEILEMDLMGRIYHMYHIEKGIHHDVCEMYVGGNLLAAGSSLEGTGEDTIIEIDRKTGEIVKEVKMSKIFDDTYQDGEDWVHVNSVSYDANTKTVTACLRNLHSVIRLDWENENLIWLFCHPDFWKDTKMEPFLLKVLPSKEKMEGDGWFYQPHAAYVLSENLDNNPDTEHLIMYDNHQDRRRTVNYFDGIEASYVRIYEINKKRRTVTLYKSFPVKQSVIRSNAIYMGKENSVFAMSGFFEKYEPQKAGAIEEFDAESKEIKNRYYIGKSFYRAYGLKFNYGMQEAVLEGDYVRGSLQKPLPGKKIGITKAVKVPDRKKDYNLYEIFLLLKQYPEKAKRMISTIQDVAYMRMRLCEHILYIHGIDHVMKKVYFIGKKHYYIKSFEDTEQKQYNSFGRLPYAVAISIEPLEADRYKIYILAEDGKMYDMGKYIECM